MADRRPARAAAPPRRGADRGGRRHPLPRRRPDVSVHRDPRRRGGSPRPARRGDRPPWAARVPGRAQPALRPDRLRDRRGDGAHALHRCRPRRASAPALRRRAAERRRHLDLRAPPRRAPAARWARPRDHRPPLGGGDTIDGRVRPPQPPPPRLARHRRAGRHRTNRRPTARPTSDRGAPRRRHPRGAEPRRLAARARHRPRARAARGG